MQKFTGNIVSALFKNGFGLLREWWERNESRRELAMMGARDLRDMEVTRGVVDAESNKPFWQTMTLQRASQEAEPSSPAVQQDDECEARYDRRPPEQRVKDRSHHRCLFPIRIHYVNQLRMPLCSLSVQWPLAFFT